MEHLFRAHHRDLVRRVRFKVRGMTDAGVEDACQHAWMKWVRLGEPVDEPQAFAYLLTTALREAWKLRARERRVNGLEEDRPATRARARSRAD